MSSVFVEVEPFDAENALPATAAGYLPFECGDGPIPFVATIEVCATPRFACCSDAGCCPPASLNAQGEVEEASPGSCDQSPSPNCTTSTEVLDLAFSDYLSQTDGTWLFGGASNSPQWHYVGDIPISTPVGTFTGRKLIIACNGSSMAAYILDGNNHLDEWPPTLTSWNCATFSGTVELGHPTDDCCPGGGGTFKVHLSG